MRLNDGIVLTLPGYGEIPLGVVVDSAFPSRPLAAERLPRYNKK